MTFPLHVMLRSCDVLIFSLSVERDPFSTKNQTL